MNGYLTKPVDLAPMAEMLSRWLSAPGAAATFNSEALLGRLMGDRELAGSVLQAFLEDVPSQLHKLRDRLDERDPQGARSHAHALKGAAATVGAEGLQALARALERAGGAGELEQCGPLLADVIQEFERFQSALQRSGLVETKTP
jgi:HPt (histidine-containing phosphotransfer) domain-containing protein